MQRVRHAPEMLADVIEVHPLPRAGKAVARQMPDPGGTIGHDQHLGGPAQAVAHGFGPELLIERVHPAAGHGIAAAQNGRPPAGALGALEAEETKAALDGGPVAGGNPAQLVLAVGTEGWGAVGFLLRSLCEHLPEQFLTAAQELFFEMAEVFVRRAERLMELPAQALEQGFATGGQEVCPRCRAGGGRKRGDKHGNNGPKLWSRRWATNATSNRNSGPPATPSAGGGLHQLLNYFLATMKLAKKERVGSRTVRVYGPTQTPMDRVLACAEVSAATQAQLRAEKAALNPLALRREVDQQMRAIEAIRRGSEA